MTVIATVPPQTDEMVEVRRFYQTLARFLNNISGGTVTLTASAASTTVSDKNVKAAGRILLCPTSANAAADVAAGNVYVSAKTADTSFVVTHPNNANADKTFDYIMFNN